MVTFAAATKNSSSFPTRAPGQRRVDHFVAITCSDPNDSCDLYNDDCRTLAQLVSPSRDPIGYESGQFSLIAYVHGEPISHLDPSGLEGYLGPGQYEPPKSTVLPGVLAGGGIFICMREVKEGTPCKAVIDACGGQHTYIQFGGVTPEGNPEEGTGGIGFTGPGWTAPGEEHAFHPSRCTRLIPPKGMSFAQAEACIRNHAPTRPFTFPRYVCSTWTNEAVNTCGLIRGDSFAW